jgi:hypothetical protein
MLLAMAALAQAETGAEGWLRYVPFARTSSATL